MEKSKIPTSRYQAFCDTFDMKLEVKIHEADGDKLVKEKKLKVTLETEDEKENLNVSLYREDVEMLIGFLAQVVPHIKSRN